MIANFIDGAFVRAEGARCFDKRSPVDGRLIASVAEAGKEQVDAAVQAARAALHGEWGRMDVAKRAELLCAVAAEIERRQIRGPAGQFVLDEGCTRPGVLMAGGIGITPLVSMLRHATAETSARKLYLFYGNRRPEDAAFLDELLELQARNPSYRLIATMAEMEKSRQPWTGETGFIGRDLLARHLVDLAAPAYYIAGPPAMVETMQEMLARAGVDAEDVRTDEFYGY